MSLPGGLHLLRPLALLLLLAIPLMAIAWRRSGRDAGAWRGAVDAHLLPFLVEQAGTPRRSGAFALAACTWIVACVALAGPAWEHESMPLLRTQSARVIVLELAQSMLAQDAKPTRLERARYKIDDILTRSRDQQSALVGYAGDAFVAAPLTDDVETVRNLVDALDPTTMPVLGNATGRAIDTAAALFTQAGVHDGDIVLIADSADADAIDAARRARAQGLSLSVLGIGTAKGAPVALAQGDFMKDDAGNVVVSRLDEAALRALADAGGGRYAAASADARDLDHLLVDGAPGPATRGEDAGDAQGERWRDRGPWLLLAVLPLALAGFRRGWLAVLVLAFGATAPVANAASFDDLWLRKDQQAAAALAAGDAKKAAELAPTPEWKGSAAYRGGDFSAAESAYAAAAGADANYNRGNALAKAGRYEDALAAYDTALAAQPGMDDAKANRAAVADYLQRRPQQSPDNKDGKDNKDGQKQDPSKDGDAKSQPGQDGSQQAPKDGSSSQPSPGENDGKEGQPGDQDPSTKDPRDAGRHGEDGDPKNSSAQSKPPDAPDAKSGDPSKADAGATGVPGEPPADAQQKALSKAVDEALQHAPEAKDDAHGEARVPVETDEAREKRQALDHWLERVPDDPGGLLRRKFQLEYQRRQQRGEGGRP